MTTSIRPLRETDAESLFEAARESMNELHPWMPWCHPNYAIDESRTWVARQLELFHSGEEYQFAIVDEAERYQGGCGLNFLDMANLRANVGYWVRSPATGRGIATAATRLVAAWGFANTKPVPAVERLLGIGVPVVIIGGTPEINDLPEREWAAVMRRPVSIGEIAERVAAISKRAL